MKNIYIYKERIKITVSTRTTFYPLKLALSMFTSLAIYISFFSSRKRILINLSQAFSWSFFEKKVVSKSCQCPTGSSPAVRAVLAEHGPLEGQVLVVGLGQVSRDRVRFPVAVIEPSSGEVLVLSYRRQRAEVRLRAGVGERQRGRGGGGIVGAGGGRVGRGRCRR